MRALGPSWLQPDSLINTFGVIGMLAIIFAESGLLIGFFLPGDSLLFTAGLLIANDILHLPLWLACVLASAAAIIGDQVGYLIGRSTGPRVFSRPDSRLFRQEYVTRAEHFFDKYGPRTIILARFVPIVRTFVPVMAGVAHMHYRTFITYNVIGGVLWATSLTLLGYRLGKIGFIRDNIEYIAVGIVLVSVIPIGIELLRARRRPQSA